MATKRAPPRVWLAFPAPLGAPTWFPTMVTGFLVGRSFITAMAPPPPKVVVVRFRVNLLWEMISGRGEASEATAPPESPRLLVNVFPLMIVGCVVWAAAKVWRLTPPPRLLPALLFRNLLPRMWTA